MTTETTFYLHPCYLEKAKTWQVIKDLVEGDQETLVNNPSYLWPHEIEKAKNGGADIARIRRERSRYLNLMEPARSRWLSFIFKNQPDITEVKDLFGDDINDVTGSGVNLEAFIRDYIGGSFIDYGRPIVYVDTYPQRSETLYEATANGERPYVELLDPLSVKDWQLSDSTNRGQFEAIRWEYEVVKKRKSLAEEPKKVKYSKEFYKVGNSVFVRTAELTKGSDGKAQWKITQDTLVPEWTEIPIVSIENCDSWLKDAKEQQLLVFNYQSAESNLINAQCYQKIIVAGDVKDSNKLKFGEYVVTFVPEGSTITVVEPVDLSPIQSAINAAIDRFFKVAFNSVMGVASDSKDIMAADSQQEAKAEFLALVKDAIQSIEDITNAFIKKWAILKGQPNFEGKVKLDKSLDIKDVDSFIAVWTAFRDEFKKIPEVTKAVLKARVDDLGIPEDTSELKDKIEKTDFQAQADQSLNGNTKQRLLDQVMGGDMAKNMQGVNGSGENQSQPAA